MDTWIQISLNGLLFEKDGLANFFRRIIHSVKCSSQDKTDRKGRLNTQLVCLTIQATKFQHWLSILQNNSLYESYQGTKVNLLHTS